MLNFYLDESLLDDTIPVLTTRMNDRLKSIYNKNNDIKLKYNYFYEDYDFPSYACTLCGAFCYCYTAINKRTVRDDMIKKLREYAWSEFRRYAKRYKQKMPQRI